MYIILINTHWTCIYASTCFKQEAFIIAFINALEYSLTIEKGFGGYYWYLISTNWCNTVKGQIIENSLWNGKYLSNHWLFSIPYLYNCSRLATRISVDTFLANIEITFLPILSDTVNLSTTVQIEHKCCYVLPRREPPHISRL